MSNDKTGENKGLADEDIMPVQNQQLCLNCSQVLTDQYCSHCGQYAKSHRQHLSTFLGQLLDDVFSFDSRASRTIIPLMFNPGTLTNEYFKGRIVRYVPPVRLYLFVSILFFISLQLFALNDIDAYSRQHNIHTAEQINLYTTELEKQKNNADQQQNIEIEKKLQRFKQYKTDISAEQSTFLIQTLTHQLVELEFHPTKGSEVEKEAIKEEFKTLTADLDKAKKGEIVPNSFNITNNKQGSFTFDFLSKEKNQTLSAYIDSLEIKAQKALSSDPTKLLKKSAEKLPQLMFLLLPLFALLLKLFYLFSNRLYLEHLTVALHSHSFIFIIMLLVQLLDFSQSTRGILSTSLTNVIDMFSQLLLLWLGVYLFIMQKRVYKQGYFMTSVKFSIIGLIYMMMIVTTSVIAFLWGVTSI